jgi:hypothetical protein
MSGNMIFTREWWETMEAPEGIRAIQGHSNRHTDVLISDDLAIAVTPGFVRTIFHSTYKRHLQSIVQSGLYPGGLAGSKSRAQVFFSMTDWREYPSGYKSAESLSFSELQREPYFPRPDCDLIVEVSLDGLINLGLEPKQNETLAVVTKAGMAVPAECIISAFDAKTGDIEWERPSASASSSSSAGGNPLQTPARRVSFSDDVENIEPAAENVDIDMDFSDPFERCLQCKAVLVAGTQYCACGAPTTSGLYTPEERAEQRRAYFDQLVASVSLRWQTAGPKHGCICALPGCSPGLVNTLFKRAGNCRGGNTFELIQAKRTSDRGMFVAASSPVSLTGTSMTKSTVSICMRNTAI